MYLPQRSETDKVTRGVGRRVTDPNFRPRGSQPHSEWRASGAALLPRAAREKRGDSRFGSGRRVWGMSPMSNPRLQHNSLMLLGSATL